MLCSANLDDQGLGFVSKLFSSGTISDFNSKWFNSIGDTIIGAMVFNSYCPFIYEILIFYPMRAVYRIKDSCLSGKDYDSSCTTVQQYINKFAGPEYFMHFKYSAMLNITFITMMFGAGMPILFSVAAFSFFSLYIVENYMLYYVYKEPPAYDEALNLEVLRKLSYGPLFLVAFGYWMLSNKQLLNNDDQLLIVKEKTNSKFVAGHVWTDVFSVDSGFHVGPGAYLLIFFGCYLVYLFLNAPINWIIGKLFPDMMIGSLTIDEDIDLYQNCLDFDDKRYTYLEEFNMRRFGIQTVHDEDLNHIRNGRQNK